MKFVEDLYLCLLWVCFTPSWIK